MPLVLRRAWIGLYLLSALALWSCERRVPTKKGDTLFEIADDAVLWVTIRAPGRYAEARRKTPAQKFTYRFERQGQPAQTCRSSAELDAALAQTYTIRVKDTVSAAELRSLREEKALEQSIDFELDDILTGVDSLQLKLFRDPKDASRLLTRLTPDSEMVAVSSELVALLELACPEAKRPKK